MRAFYSDRYVIKLPERHRFPIIKYALIRIVFYQAGVDPFEGDLLGRLALTLDGLRMRDEMVFSECHRRSLPCAITLGGGYARDVRDTVEAHCNTVRAACSIFGD